MTAEDWRIRFHLSSDRFIAKGSFGEVYGPCDWKGSTCAVKKLWINKDVSETDTAKQLSSYRKMIELHHKHIITVHVVSLEPPHIFMMMDYAGGGSLKDVLGKLKFHLPLDILKDWGIQIAQGMAYLHGREMVHRDLKSPNIVIMEPDASSDPNNKTLKITDFDQVREQTGTKTTSFAGTYAWSAPEVITEEKFSKASDVWSYGVVLWEILTRKVPHKDLSNQSIINNASKGSLTLDIPDSCPDIIKCILNECLRKERRQRPSFDNILSMFQNNISVAGEDSKTSDGQHMDRKQSRSLGNRIKTLVMNLKKTAPPLEQNINSSETVKTIKEQMKQWRLFLEDHMDPNFGLLDKLLANGFFSRREIDDVKSKSSLLERNSRLLDLIFAKDVCDGLITALRDAGQLHVVNYLTANGEYSDKFREDWPLQKRERSILDTNQESLVDLLELRDLLSLLFSSKILNKRQHEWISSKLTSFEKNEALLDILGRGSLHDYRQTIKCLRQSKQSNIAEILESGGVVVKAHANLSGENVTKNEEELVTKIENLLSDYSVDDPSRIFDIIKCNVIATKQGQSIVLYIYCKIIEELQLLHELLTSGQLKDSVELWFKSLLVGSQITTVASLKASAEEFQRQRKYFKDMASEEQTFKTTIKEAMISHATSEAEAEAEHQPSKTTINELPLELLDAVLEKSFLHLILKYSHILRDEGVFVKALASVDFCWFQRTTRLRFKRRIWQRLKDVYGKTETSSTIIRNNRNYLLKNILSNSKLIASLLSYNCITEAQGRCIRRKRSNSNSNTTKDQSHFFQRQCFNRYKNSELLHALRSLDDTKLLNFLTCCRQTNQKTAARIMENGGGVIKVEVRNHGAKCTMESLRKNIEDLLIKTNPRSHKTDELISQLKDEGIEILNSELDRDTVVVWIWCRSQAALTNCQRVYESNQLRDVLFRVANTFLTDQSKVINIDRNQFKKTIVVRPISISFTQRIYVRRNEIVHGVTKLKNEIYLLCQSASSSSGSNVINVFDDGNPSRLQRKINIKQIDFPTDMGSSEKDNCLYVCDFYVRAIWKITKESDGEHNVIMWLTIGYKPSILSVSSEGQLFVLSYTKLNRSTMKVYESDAALIESIQLPEDIGELHHTAQTSNGNFIVSSYMEEEDEEEEEEEGEEEDGEWVEKKEGHSGSSRTKRRKMNINSMVSELTRDGQKVIRRFNALNKEQRLRGHSFISLDSDDRVFVIDPGNQRVILLDSDLKWNQVLCPVTEQETKIVRPIKLFYDGEKKQLIVGGFSEGEGVNVYNLSRA